MKSRNIVLAIIFSIITFGLYHLYWLIVITDESNRLANKEWQTNGLKALIFSIITFGLYAIYWSYKLGENYDYIKYDEKVNGGLLFLVLSLFGLGIVNMVLLQSAINNEIEGSY